MNDFIWMPEAGRRITTAAREMPRQRLRRDFIFKKCRRCGATLDFAIDIYRRATAEIGTSQGRSGVATRRRITATTAFSYFLMGWYAARAEAVIT